MSRLVVAVPVGSTVWLSAALVTAVLLCVSVLGCVPKGGPVMARLCARLLSASQ
jgi:hypothetical protein